MNKKLLVIPIVILILIGSYLAFKGNDGVEIDLENDDTRSIVEALENASNDDVIGVVHQDYIEITQGSKKTKIYDEEDMFYVSIAPYIDFTHA